jgi:uncharacterized damage-inducible protein DinB
MTALTMRELTEWVERTATGWRALIAQHPEVLSFPCDIRETNSVGELIQHIVAVQLRYAERLNGLAETSYDDIPHGSGEEIFAIHDRSIALLKDLPPWSEEDWEVGLAFSTRSAGVLKASRRTVFVHLLMHSIRHYAQLATIVRHNGVKPDWGMDYLLMGATSA